MRSILLAVLPVIVLLQGCSSTQITNSCPGPEYPSGDVLTWYAESRPSVAADLWMDDTRRLNDKLQARIEKGSDTTLEPDNILDAVVSVAGKAWDLLPSISWD